MRSAWILLFGVAMAAGSAFGQTSPAPNDAAALYRRAAKILSADDARNIMSPSASNLEYPEYPPMPDAWLRMEKQDYDAHAQVRQLVHQAASMTRADWPQINPKDVSYLNELRNVANEIADAAEYQSFILKDQPAAFESAGDLMHMADLLKNQPNENLIRLLVAAGIEAMDAHRLMVIQANATITEDHADNRDLPLSTAKAWITRLLDHPTAQAEVDQAMKWELAQPGAATQPMAKPSMDRLLETVRRVQAERDFAAMALAAQIYRHQHGRWPANLDELATELPRVPLDAWGDGKQTLGYVLIKGGLPNGSDRPLLYSRDVSKDGMFFPTDEPEYGFYIIGGWKTPVAERKQGGQFRDVAAWVPPAEKKSGPTTQALP